MKTGYFIVVELAGPVLQEVSAIQRMCDPKLANGTTPHITLVGSSGVGPIPADTPVTQIDERIAPITSATPPIVVRFGAPVRFMQTEIVVLPLDPHGALRTLHERIATSGLTFERARFPFSPHCTLSFFRTITPAMQQRLLSIRINAPLTIAHLQVYQTLDPQPSRKVLELELEGG
ncbi:MAG TPA: 2'-5' RNA ligase family protein [Gemmatimonadaceae bacterium]|nr:2'-5' RNA ligase family protein [Gemmatimonadaceae bacterium]